ncbi:hypothetical protein [Galactobacter valiniphilus]|uniref:hypothetical protein n=1 Tax=Galactobacter valiniphilus TaxID=2676122 RepID=UPI003734F94F
MPENHADVIEGESPSTGGAAAKEPTVDRLFTVPGTGLVVSGWIVTIVAVVWVAYTFVMAAQNDEPVAFTNLLLGAILAGLGLFVVLIGQLQRMTSVLAGRHKEPAPPTP